MVESSPATLAAAATAGGVEVASAPNREGSRDRLKQSQREAKHTRLQAQDMAKGNLSKPRVWNNIHALYMYVSDYLPVGIFTVFRPCTVRFFQIIYPTVRFGAVLENRKSYDAVRGGCRFCKSYGAVRFGFVIYPTVRFGAVFKNRKSYGAVRFANATAVSLRCTV